MKRNNRGKIFWPFVLLALIFLIWFIRYPLWSSLSNLELIFLMMIASYFIIFSLSLTFLKKDAKKSLRQVFKLKGPKMPLLSIGFSLLFQFIWFSLFMLFGGTLSFSVPPGISPYSRYVPYSVALAFGLYLTFTLFGAFTEEVTFRSYVQSRFASRFGLTVGILAGAIFFSLQHIQFFVSSWIVQFFQNQFIYVFCGGVFIGLFFVRTGEDIWSAFAFHGTGNLCNILLPIASTAISPFSSPAASITGFTVFILLLQLLTKGKNKKYSFLD
jgi:membrane protease YdiL (CAAX protease family)